MFARLAMSAAVVTLGASLAAMAPEPDPIPRRWQLAVEAGALRVASVEVQGEGTKAFYFMTYKVTNTTDQDLLFTPSFELGTDEGEVLRSGRNVPTQVTKDIMDRLDSPFIQDQTSIVGVLPQGEANAKEGVVIWPVNDLHVNEVTIYGAGFSGETRAVEYKNAKGETEKALLRKTLMLRYQTPGEIRDMAGRSLELTEKQWIMR